MANLVEAGYLHSQKWTFFNYSNTIDINPKNIGLSARGQATINELKKLYNDAQKREMEFYTDFGVSTARQWSEKYLLRGNEDTDEKKILSIINSPQMIKILSVGQSSNDFSEERKVFIKYLESLIEKNVDYSEIINSLIDKAKTSNAMSPGVFFKDLGILGAGKYNNSTISNKDIQQFLFGNMSLTEEIPKKALYGLKSEKLNKFFKKLMSKHKTPTVQKMTLALQYLETQLRQKGLNEEKIKTVKDAFSLVLQENLTGENRLMHQIEQTITGEVQEVGEVIAYINFEDPFTIDKKGSKIINSLVSQVGRELNQQDKKSKVDTIWRGKNSQKDYFIQDKNSNADIYNEFRIADDISNLDKYDTFLSIQSDASLTYLLEQLQTYGILTPYESELLTYLLINYNVLNKNFISDRLYKSAQKGGVAATKTQSAIEIILAKAIQYFLSDKLLPENIKDGFVDKSNDFIIFMSRILIPKSLILKNLIQMLENYQHDLLRIQATSYLKGYGEGNYKNMVDAKTTAVESEGGFNSQLNYSNSDLVNAGAAAGEVAKNVLHIRRINLKFKVKNLIQNAGL